MSAEFQGRALRKTEGFALPEILVASLLVALLVMVNMAAMYQMRIMSYKDAERGIVSGYMQHYAELVKALPFDQVITNQPLSGLLSGVGGTPRIAIPSNGNWFNLTDDNYQRFHSGLLWITNRHPQMKVVLEIVTNGGFIHDKHISIEVRWDAPLVSSAQLNQRMDLFRVKDL
ncbi:MAG: hypothetical protein JWM99_1752 [Verrucomicrobiales bacterium]|nr:hypothetical protein [Verrucomicrobiales bacterium]